MICRGDLQKTIIFLRTSTDVTSLVATKLCLITQITKNRLATSLYGCHQDFVVMWVTNSWRATHGWAETSTYLAKVGPKPVPPLWPLLWKIDGGTTANAGTQFPLPVSSLKLSQPLSTTTFASSSLPIHAFPYFPPPLRPRPIGHPLRPRCPVRSRRSHQRLGEM